MDVPEKAEAPMVATELPKVTSIKGFDENALLPIEVTPLPVLNDTSCELLKALSPMVVTV